MIRVFDDLQKLSFAAAQLICDACQKNISEKGNFSLVLSGGATPRTTYQLLAENFFSDRMDWKGVKNFFGDERYVPHDDARSNFRMVNETLLNHVPIPRENVFPVPTDSTPEKDALEYEEVLKKNFFTPFPQFDLILLGLGENGHTASLFPHTGVLNEQLRWVREVYVEEDKSFRITLTVPAINASKQIVFLVSGKNKSQTLYDVLKGKPDPQKLPAQLIQGEIIWMMDRDAGELLAG